MPVTSTLTDNFSTDTKATNWPGSAAQVTISGGVATIPFSAGLYYTMRTAASYSLDGSWVAVQHVSALASSTFLEYVPNIADTTTRISWYLTTSGYMEFGYFLSGVFTALAGATPSPTPSWFGFSCVADVIKGWHSQDGVTWTEFGSGARPGGLVVTANTGVVRMMNGSATVDMVVDNFNLPTNPPVGAGATSAGSDQADIEPYATVTLTGTVPSGSPTWSQTSGTTVTLSSVTVLSPTFTAPATSAGGPLVFSLTNGSSADTVTVTVLPHDLFTRRSGAWVATETRVRRSSAWL